MAFNPSTSPYAVRPPQSSILQLAWRGYLNQLKQHPLRTKALTAACIAALSDVIAQRILTGGYKSGRWGMPRVSLPPAPAIILPWEHHRPTTCTWLRLGRREASPSLCLIPQNSARVNSGAR